MITTLLFDFYNTLYAAQEWFELEVRELPSETLRVLAGRGEASTAEQQARAREAWRRLRQGIESAGREISAEDGLRRVLAEVGVSVPEDLPQIVMSLQQGAYRLGREEPGMEECVRGLVEQGYRLGIVSNALSEDFLRWSLADTGISDCFSGIYASAAVGYYKSSPRLYEAALAGLGAHPEQTLHVGDSYKYDVRGARAAGIRTVWYAPGGDKPPSDDADAVIRHLSELPGVLRRLSQAAQA